MTKTVNGVRDGPRIYWIGIVILEALEWGEVA